MLEALLLGIVQGLTEFLPISSSGHLVLFSKLWGKGIGESLDFVVAVHLGTLAAVCWVFRKNLTDILAELPVLLRPREWRSSLEREPFRLAVGIMLATAITGVLGFMFQDIVESAFKSLLGVGIAFFCVGCFLYVTRFAKRRNIGIVPLGFLVGIAQSVALMPGVSRSGATIGTALLAGSDMEFAARLSFLIAIPAIIGAAIFELLGKHGGSVDIGVLLVGLASSLVSGIFALRILLKLVRIGRFYIFSYYLWVVGIVTVIVALVNVQ